MQGSQALRGTPYTAADVAWDPESVGQTSLALCQLDALSPAVLRDAAALADWTVRVHGRRGDLLADWSVERWWDGVVEVPLAAAVEKEHRRYADGGWEPWY